MRIQPIDADGATRPDHAKPAVKSRLKRLVLRFSSSSDKLAAGDAGSVPLDKMVWSFMEDGTADKPPSKPGRCNCFQFNFDDEDDGDDHLEVVPAASAPGSDAADLLKGLLVCASVAERNLAADASAIMEKIGDACDGSKSRVLADGLRSLGYDAAVCRSRWEKAASHPAGEHEYVDVIAGGGGRIIVDADFRSEFEIVRSTKSYRALLQCLPAVFVGTADRAARIAAVVSEAARLSLKKKGLHFPPWRQPEYMRAKWLAPHERETVGSAAAAAASERDWMTWQLPAARPKASQSGPRVVTGLASVLSA